MTKPIALFPKLELSEHLDVTNGSLGQTILVYIRKAKRSGKIDFQKLF